MTDACVSLGGLFQMMSGSDETMFPVSQKLSADMFDKAPKRLH